MDESFLEDCRRVGPSNCGNTAVAAEGSVTAGMEVALTDGMAGAGQGENTIRLNEAMRELLGAPLAAAVEYVFAHVRIAEDEIADFKQRYLSHANKLDATFLRLRWQLGVDAPEPVFRHHARELLQRVVDSEPLGPGTNAEALMILHVTSLDAPLAAEAVEVAVKLFGEVFGEVDGITDYQSVEPWPGACDELLGTIIRKLSCDRDSDRQ